MHVSLLLRWKLGRRTYPAYSLVRITNSNSYAMNSSRCCRTIVLYPDEVEQNFDVRYFWCRWCNEPGLDLGLGEQ